MVGQVEFDVGAVYTMLIKNGHWDHIHISRKSMEERSRRMKIVANLIGHGRYGSALSLMLCENT
jgi:hypothetical protein